MKIRVTYEAADLIRLIKQDLESQGIKASDASIELKKGTALVSVEVSSDAPPEELLPAKPVPVYDTTDKLKVLEGGQNPVDMSSILGESKKINKTKDGKFPQPDRHLLPGESYDFPGDK